MEDILEVSHEVEYEGYFIKLPRWRGPTRFRMHKRIANIV